MRRFSLLTGAVALSLLAACQGDVANAPPREVVSTTQVALGSLPHTMELTSPAFLMDARIPDAYTCNGENHSPTLEVTGVPLQAQSLILVMSDPDAPDDTFYHWVMWNLPGQNQVIDSGSVPSGAVQGTNSAGNVGFTGPCPQEGARNYNITVMALSTTLDLPETATVPDVLAAAQDFVLDQAGLVGMYSK